MCLENGRKGEMSWRKTFLSLVSDCGKQENEETWRHQPSKCASFPPLSHAGGLNSVITSRAVDVRWGFGGSGQIMQMARAVKQYDLVFPVARVWAALKKKELNVRKGRQSYGCDIFLVMSAWLGLDDLIRMWALRSNLIYTFVFSVVRVTAQWQARCVWVGVGLLPVWLTADRVFVLAGTCSSTMHV